MDTRITARHFTLSEDLRGYVTDRVGRLERFYDGITDARIVLTMDRGRPLEKEAEITLSVYKQRLSAQTTAETLEVALDECVDSLRRQLLRYKSKLRRTDRKLHR